MTSYALQISTALTTTSKNSNRFVRHDLFRLNPCWELLRRFRSSRCATNLFVSSKAKKQRNTEAHKHISKKAKKHRNKDAKAKKHISKTHINSEAKKHRNKEAQKQ